ncbi:Probable ion channel POLLUX [Striga hermonthica]|uniref:Probable ion channel POLLUX n=1 Tax=Striga hermonthica TaxID=68872 RepID=A0A9N7MM99_STRHE|nr:Probable ion channel POLLUX [Striga hermonthica]
MVAEDKQIHRMLEELFAEKGNEMCIKPGEFYLYDQEEISFFEIMEEGGASKTKALQSILRPTMRSSRHVRSRSRG